MGSTVCFCSFCTQHEIARSFSLSRPSLPLSLKPRQRLTPISSTEATVLATTDMVSATMVWATGATTMARGRPRLSPRLLLIPTCCTEATTAMDLATTAATTAMDWPTTERGRLRPSPRLLLIPTCCTVATDSATGPTATPTSTDITMERGRLRLRLIPTTTVATTAMDSDTATVTVLATGPTGDKLLK